MVNNTKYEFKITRKVFTSLTITICVVILIFQQIISQFKCCYTFFHYLVSPNFERSVALI